MGGQCFLINHTRQHIIQIANDAWYDIFQVIRDILKDYLTWTLNDTVELFRYEQDDRERIHYLIEEGYVCNHKDWFM